MNNECALVICQDQFCPLVGRPLDDEDCRILNDFLKVKDELLLKDASLTDIGATVGAWMVLMDR